LHSGITDEDIERLKKLAKKKEEKKEGKEITPPVVLEKPSAPT
jgi:hypothetical protein